MVTIQQIADRLRIGNRKIDGGMQEDH